MKNYCVFCKEVMACEVLYVAQFLVCFQLSVEGFFVDFFFQLLSVCLFVGEFHISESFGLLFFELSAVLVDLQSLLVEGLLLELLHLLAAFALFLLLLPPHFGLQLLDALPVAAGCVLRGVLRSSPAKILRLEGPWVCVWKAWV